MTETIETDIAIIGAGSGGLSVAAGAAQMGARTVLIEAGAMGGDCLNVGCVPSKSLIAAADAAHCFRMADRFGIAAVAPSVDFAAVNDHVHAVIAAIAPHDSVERFEGLGVRVIRETGRFVGPDRLRAGSTEITAKRVVIATGSRPAVPPIPGLDRTPYLTNETLFGLRVLPRHLIVIGGGPIGLEMAQAHRRLGAAVTVVEAARLLSRDDVDLVARIRDAVVADGVAVIEGTGVTEVGCGPGGTDAIRVRLADGRDLTGSHLLVAVGRTPNIEQLDLAAGGVAATKAGVTVDDRLRTTNKQVFAIGDVAGGPQFTHVAGYHASVVIKNALFRLPAKVDYRALPRVTYTRPELAQVGLTEAEARAGGRTDLRILTWRFADNDRAQTEKATAGIAKMVATKTGRVLGAGIVGPHAGELIQVWGLMIGRKVKLGALASQITAYPTLSEVSKRAAGSFFTPGLFSERTRRIVRLLLRLG